MNMLHDYSELTETDLKKMFFVGSLASCDEESRSEEIKVEEFLINYIDKRTTSVQGEYNETVTFVIREDTDKL